MASTCPRLLLPKGLCDQVVRSAHRGGAHQLLHERARLARARCEQIERGDGLVDGVARRAPAADETINAGARVRSVIRTARLADAAGRLAAGARAPLGLALRDGEVELHGHRVAPAAVRRVRACARRQTPTARVRRDVVLRKVWAKKRAQQRRAMDSAAKRTAAEGHGTT
eukprot:2442031-Pleurochrysis_carterae.AAC.5